MTEKILITMKRPGDCTCGVHLAIGHRVLWTPGKGIVGCFDCSFTGVKQKKKNNETN